MLHTIDHVNVVVSDLDEAKAFFRQLGFSIGNEGRLEGEWISAIVGLPDVKARYVTLSLGDVGTNLELIQYYSPASGQDPWMSKANQLGYRHIAFEVEDLERTVQDLKEKGVTFLSPIQTYPETGKRLVYFYGPDMILLELAQYPNPAEPEPKK
ncbi:MAG: VOC family protein [Candidatus Scalindua sp. AMX11]|nr:MAG: VOC family protein [Candidatus Scalindua sp.]NOG84832.1 VOC family protein [Planctomycetota bacterium]RZV61724.1 MAG: VOC family protein [Candidatus Scalindua sp. SCAELEC01]TDE63274.1 MAG: VOC family protein [Candidatus Scalindua sp. AMX11]GJQ60927.1 MAG: hypothetical protein SCALA701_37280 [Candidatus Scalindua sp.]